LQEALAGLRAWQPTITSVALHRRSLMKEISSTLEVRIPTKYLWVGAFLAFSLVECLVIYSELTRYSSRPWFFLPTSHAFDTIIDRMAPLEGVEEGAAGHQRHCYDGSYFLCTCNYDAGVLSDPADRHRRFSVADNSPKQRKPESSNCCLEADL